MSIIAEREIPISSYKEKIFTYKDIDNLPEGNYEIIEGKIIEMTPVNLLHGILEMKIARVLGNKLENKGYILGGETGILTQKDSLKIRGMDIAFISKERLKKIEKGLLKIAPEVIIEIISPFNNASDIRKKTLEYINMGVDKVVNIYLDDKKVVVIEQNRKIQEHDINDDISIIYDINLNIGDLLSEIEGV